MPTPDLNQRLDSFEMGQLGVNLRDPISAIRPGECLLSQNLIWRNGMVKRQGSSTFESDEVAASKRIVGLHRFYPSGASAILIAASGTVVKYHNGTTWAAIDATVGQSQTTDKQTHFVTWGAVDKVFGANGTDLPFTWDGASTAATITATSSPAQAIQFLPYQDRLLAIDSANPGDLTWSASFSETSTWETVANCGVRPDSKLFGMIIHSLTNSDAGFQSKVLLAGASGMYLFGGSDLRVPSTTGNYTVYPLSINSGCNAPRTMAWTPAGSMWLGIDRQVYILPFGSSTPIPVGDKIRSNGVTSGIEEIPSGQIQNACAVYHDGYYKLSVTRAGQTTNDRQWWLDILRLRQDENGIWGPWYGPMTGQSINCFALQSGDGDSGQLMAGDSGTSLVYQVDQSGVYGDSGSAIDCEFRTYFNNIGDPRLPKEIHRSELELLNINANVNVGFQDITGSLAATKTVSLDGASVLWDSTYNWDSSVNWTSETPTRKIVNSSPPLRTRRLSMIITNSTSNANFELYDIHVESTETREVFG